MSVVHDMVRARFAVMDEPEVWLLGETAMGELELELGRNAYQAPPPPPGFKYETQFQGTPVVALRSAYGRNRVELHSRDYMGEPTIRVVRY